MDSYSKRQHNVLWDSHIHTHTRVNKSIFFYWTGYSCIFTYTHTYRNGNLYFNSFIIVIMIIKITFFLDLSARYTPGVAQQASQTRIQIGLV